MEADMSQKKSPTEALREKNNVIDQRQQQIDPAGHHRVDPNHAAKGSQKQPGQDPEAARDAPAPSAGRDPDQGRMDQPEHRQNAQGRHAGSAHGPAAFDTKNPEKQGVGITGKPSDRKPPKPED